MDKVSSFIVSTPIGNFSVIHNENRVLEIDMGVDTKKIAKKAKTNSTNLSPFAQKVKKKLVSYFSNSDEKLNIEIDAAGTQFQQSVWQVIRTIKTGKTMTYSEIAEKLGSSPRAVGNACRANPIPIIVPCHRVVAKSGLGGFAGMSTGFNLDMKKWLLKHEDVLSVNDVN